MEPSTWNATQCMLFPGVVFIKRNVTSRRDTCECRDGDRGWQHAGELLTVTKQRHSTPGAISQVRRKLNV